MVDGVEQSVEPLNMGIVYGAASGTLYRASDCTVQTAPYPSTSPSASLPNLKIAFQIDVYTLSGELWPYYPE